MYSLKEGNGEILEWKSCNCLDPKEDLSLASLVDIDSETIQSRRAALFISIRFDNHRLPFDTRTTTSHTHYAHNEGMITRWPEPSVVSWSQSEHCPRLALHLTKSVFRNGPLKTEFVV